MKNPYFIDEPCLHSFSGGRTSGYSLVRTLESHNGIMPPDQPVVFCNTGKERNETLDFVHACERELSVDIVWLELSSMVRLDHGYAKTYKITDYENASRNGEPFQYLLDAMPAIPNVVNMACTAYLKARIMRMYADDIGLERGCLTTIGMRYDEQRRVRNAHGKKIEGFEGYCPLYLDGVTQSMVRDFWDSMPWNLELPMLPDGSCPAGNCDLCHKKSIGKREQLIAANPNMADWWINAENQKKQRFRPDQPSYEEMKQYAADQMLLFGDMIDESIPCFCGD